MASRFEAVVSSGFLDDLRFWARTDRRVTLRILELMDAILRDPYQGVGRPEPLKYALSGAWSRRITAEHRLVYAVNGARVEFLQARFHYQSS